MRGKEAGLTLIELLLALTLLSLIVGSALSFMRVAERARARGAEEEEASRRARLVMERISQTLRSAVQYTPSTGGTFEAESDRLTFLTIAGPGGPREIRYRVEDDPETGAKQLIEEERVFPGLEPFGQGEGEKRVLDRAVGRISFRYHSSEGAVAGRPGVEQGGRQVRRLYRAVEVSLSIATTKDGKEELVDLPPRVITLFTTLVEGGR